MLILLSPSKTLDFENQPPIDEYTQPEYIDEVKELVDILEDYSVEQLGELMDISQNLSELNVERYDSFEFPFDLDNAKQSIFAFQGDVYKDFDFDAYGDSEYEFLQDHVRILSGLYGILRPLDVMQPYRLEMGTKLENPRGDDLYEFWGDKLTESVNRALDAQGDDIILNLASNQYFRSLNKDELDGRIISPSFKDERNGSYMVISFYLKRLRGTMTDFVIKNDVTNPEELTEFDRNDYYYSPERSTEDEPVFLRDEES